MKKTLYIVLPVLAVVFGIGTSLIAGGDCCDTQEKCCTKKAACCATK